MALLLQIHYLGEDVKELLYSMMIFKEEYLNTLSLYEESMDSYETFNMDHSQLLKHQEDF